MLRIFLIVIVLFVVFLSVSVNFARAFRVKNGVISIIEQYEGINSNSIPKVKNYIKRMGYSCYEKDKYNSVSDYVLMIDSGHPYGVSKEDNNKKIYDVQVCVKWNFPIFDVFGTWKFTGKTEYINDAVEN